MREPYPIKRYSEAFKKKIVREFEKGKHSISKLGQFYDIGGANTIHKWIKTYGNENLISITTEVKMKNEEDKIKQLKQELKLQKELVSKLYTEKFVYEKIMEYAKEKMGIDLEKKYNAGSSGKLSNIKNLSPNQEKKSK